MFKVGDTIIGNEHACRYSITTVGWIGKVVRVKKSGNISVQDERGGPIFDVDQACFNHLQPPLDQTALLNILA